MTDVSTAATAVVADLAGRARVAARDLALLDCSPGGRPRAESAVQHPHVLVVEVDVDVAVELAVLAEQLGGGVGVLGSQGAQDLADVGAGGLDLGLAARFRAQDRWDANGGHRAVILVQPCG